MMLDAKTIGLMATLIPSALAVAMWDYRRTRKTYPGFEQWLFAYLFFGMGYLLVGLRENIPSFFSIIAGNCLAVYSLVLMNKGINLFFNRPPDRQIMLKALFLVYFISQMYFAYIQPDIKIRVILLSAVFILMITPSIKCLYKGAPPYLQKISKSVAFILLLSSMLNAFRMLHVAGMQDSDNVFSDPSLSWYSLLFIACITSISFYFFFLNSARVERDLELAHQELLELANTDPLTGLYNRRHFFEHAAAELDRSERYGLNLSILVIDIDIFKKINDNHGHAAGDALLAHAANIFRRQVRSFDLVARIGGDEFIILLAEADESKAHGIAKRIQEAIELSPLLYEGLCVKTRLSVGLSSRSEKDENLESLIKRADKALYTAKDMGRNRIVTASLEGRA